jgi:O-antigen/teichoic acid export membrane protein
MTAWSPPRARLRLEAGARRLLALGSARGLASLLAFTAVLVTARALDPHELGRWSMALAVQGYALHLAEFGLRGVVTTEAARAGAALPRLLQRYLGLRLLFAGLVLAAIVAGTTLLRLSSAPISWSSAGASARQRPAATTSPARSR